MPKRQQSSSSSSQDQSSDSGSVKFISVQVSQLTPNVTQQHLREIFSHFGSIKSVSLNRASKLSSAILQFEKKAEADLAINFMNNGYIDGMKIIVESEKQEQKIEKSVEIKKSYPRKQYIDKQKRISKYRQVRDRRDRRPNKQRKDRRRRSISSSSSSAVSSSGSSSDSSSKG